MKFSAWARFTLTLVVASVVAFHAVRVAILTVAPARQSLDARRFWPSHPAVLADAVMTEVGAAAGKGQQLAQPTRADVAILAAAAPLAVEPYLIEAARAETEGRIADSEALLIAARARDPRSAAARYLLANTYLQTNRVVAGLAEVAAFARLVPAATGHFISTLSAYARTPGAIDELRTLFRGSPELQTPVLAELAQDPANASLIQRLWSGNALQTPSPAWQATLLEKLVEAGEYDAALRAWRSFAGVKLASGMFNPDFQKLDAPAPFNWTFSSSPTGAAEPSVQGLEITYFGRDDGVLASQLMLLPAGSYTLASDSTGDIAGVSIEWMVTCLPSKRVVLRLPLKSKGSHIVTGRLPVSGDCRAQRIELVAHAGDVARTIAVTVAGLKLARAPS